MKKISLLLPLFTFFSPLNAKAPASRKVNEKIDQITPIAHRLNTLRSEGLTALDAHNFDKAEQLFKEILSLKPEEWLDEKEYNEILIYTVRAEIQTRHLNEAEMHLSQLLEEGQSDVVIYNREALNAKIQFLKGQPNIAIHILYNLIEQFPLHEWDLNDQKFYMKVKGEVDKHYEDLFTQAERCFESGIYEETIPIYKEILTALNTGVYRNEGHVRLPYEIMLRLAFCELQIEEYQKAKDLLTETKKHYTALFDSDSFYQLIVCCRELKKYDEALDYCQEYLTFKYGSSKEQPILFEIARLHYLQGEKIKSKRLLENLLVELKDPYFLKLTRFYMAKLLMEDKKYTEVESILHPDHFKFEQSDPLKCEWAYLRAEAFYYRKQYEMAIAGFKEALMHPSIKKADWYYDTLYNLGFSYMKLGEDRLMQDKSKQDLLSSAEAAFKDLLNAENSDRSRLALGRAYLMRHYYLKDPIAKEKIYQLYKNYSFKEIEAKLEAGFILADMSELSNKEKIYESLCSEEYQEAHNYGKSWYYRGVYYSQMHALSEDQEYLKKSIECFKKGYAVLKENYPYLSIASIKNMITAYLNSDQESALMEAYAFLDDFLKNEINFVKVKAAELDLACLKAELCLRLVQREDESYFDKGVSALDQIKEKEGKFSDKAQFLKARLFYQHKDYEKAKTSFEALLQSSPKSPYAGYCLFWLAECNEMEGLDKSLTKEYRKKVYEDFPECSLAPEAYFLSYSFAEYLEAGKEALDHLRHFKDRFKNSPYLISSYYLIGLNQKQAKKGNDGLEIEAKNLTEALQNLTEAKNTFLKFYDEKIIPKNNLLYFASVYYQASLLSAQIYLEKADESHGAKRHIHLEKALECFNEIYADFVEAKKPYTALLYQEAPYPKIFEEASFGRSLAYAKNGQIQEAEIALSEVIQRYGNMKVKKGHYLSRAWYELAMISMAKEEYQDALEYYIHAEEAQDLEMISGDQKIDLGIQQSLCYRFLGQLDMAMLTLSKVINEGVISNLRVKAMVLRAEIYEMQGRSELALKQLEAASKKGGEWGRVAKEKLVKDYGVN